MRRRLQLRHLEELLVRGLMLTSMLLVAGSLGSILWTVLVRGLPALTWSMLTQPPGGGYYLGNQGGILNAILGSLFLALGGSLLGLVLSLPLVLILENWHRHSAWGRFVRLSLDVLWGIPSIVYGAFAFSLMLAAGLRASLLGGMLVLALVELPIMARTMDEVLRLLPADLEQAALALGASRWQTALGVILRQAQPGMVTALLLAFGRGIGDAASVLFTAGYTDHLPTSLLRPVASLPLAVFFQLGTPYPQVQQRAYASALVLTLLVLAVSLGSRWVSARLGRHVIR